MHYLNLVITAVLITMSGSLHASNINPLGESADEVERKKYQIALGETLYRQEKKALLDMGVDGSGAGIMILDSGFYQDSSVQYITPEGFQFDPRAEHGAVVACCSGIVLCW